MRLIVSLSFLVLIGCTNSSYFPKLNPVSGHVFLITGAPAFGAEVLFIPKLKDNKFAGCQSSGILNRDGSFTLKSSFGEGIPNGFYCVVVNPYNLRGSDLTGKSTGVNSIPRKFWCEDTSDLTVEITGPESDLKIKLNK